MYMPCKRDVDRWGRINLQWQKGSSIYALIIFLTKHIPYFKKGPGLEKKLLMILKYEILSYLYNGRMLSNISQKILGIINGLYW